MKTLFLFIAMAVAVSYSLPANAQNQVNNSVLQPVYQAYFALKDALVSDNEDVGKSAAALLYENIAKVPIDKLGDNKDVWMKFQSKLSFDAGHMKASDIAHQREHFVSLSKNMYEVMKVFNYGKTVYYQHCPMFNKKDGGANWLSLDKGIKNPYFGAKMLTCGKTVETLK